MAGRKIDYLFLRAGSRNWHLKLQYPPQLAELVGQKRIEKSLGTPDRAEAEIRAMPLIREHKIRLLQAWYQVDWGAGDDTKPRFKLAPGREHVGEDGGRIIATEQQLLYLDEAGQIIKQEPNRAQVLLTDVSFPSVQRQRAIVRRERERRRVTNDHTEDRVIETYVRHASLTGYNEREARQVWELYKELTNNKPLKEATRDDGRKLADYFSAKGLKSGSIKKKIGWLNAAVNLAINENKLAFNPFTGVVPKSNDQQRRLPLSEKDLELLRSNVGRLDARDRLLLRLLATTGMRLSEAFEIDTEYEESSCRFVIVGKKTAQSQRRVPIPTALEDHLPPRITGTLFNGNARSASKRLNHFLKSIGISDPRKVTHSLRHRAQDRLRAAGCPIDLRWAILGHEKKTVSESYGLGFPVPLLKGWVDKIGF